jgi:hypothetical protein
LPAGYLTEAGPRPEFAELSEAVEMPTASYPERTKANVKTADRTVWFGSTTSKGYTTTHQAALYLDNPLEIVYGSVSRPSTVVAWMIEKKIRVLNVAGNRESVMPGIGERAERFLIAVFRPLAKHPEP